MKAVLVFASVLGSLSLPLTAQNTMRLHHECDAAGRCWDERLPDQPAQTERVPQGFLPERTENGDFLASSGLRAWTAYLSDGALATLEWSPNDVFGWPSSGSVHLRNSTVGASNAYSFAGLRQCVRPGNIVVGQPFTVAARIFIPVGQSGPPGDTFTHVGILMTYYANPDCTGASSGYGQVAFFTGMGGAWNYLSDTSTAPASRTSVRLDIIIRKRNDVSPLEAYLDNVTLQGSYGFVKGDLDRDGETDLILHHNPSGTNQAWFMNNEQLTGPPLTMTPTPANLDWQVAGVDDFNADGRNDLLMWNAVSGASEFWLMNGGDRVGAAVPLAGALPLPWKPSATADFNHDNRPDIVWRNFATQKISVWTMNGTVQSGSITPNPDQALDVNWEIVATQDLNADGNVDFLWYNSTSGKIVYWWMNASVVRITGNFTNPPNAGANNWKVLAGGDYGIGPSSSATALAGTNDIVWRNADSGRLVVWFMDNAGNRTSGLFMPDPPAPATEWTVAGPR